MRFPTSRVLTEERKKSRIVTGSSGVERRYALTVRFHTVKTNIYNNRFVSILLLILRYLINCELCDHSVEI